MPLPETHITPDSLNINVGVPSSDSSIPTTVFFVPGNPGLISYYYSFLPLLSQYLQLQNDSGVTGAAGNGTLKSGVRICGTSLGGFEVEDENAGRGFNDEAEGRKKLYGLEDQIEFVERSLWNTVKGLKRAEGNTKPKVILMGHSVGAYITMELLRRHREGEAKVGLDQMDIVGAVLLFPTVVDIAKSPSGVKATVRLFDNFPLSSIPYISGR
jgi:pimeloyl-ACP methyl ester carboxylesterase